MPTDKEQKETKEKIQGDQSAITFTDAAADISLAFEKSTESSSKSMIEKISDKLSESTKDTLDNLKKLSRPGGLIKSVGLMTGSPGIMLLGDKLNDTLDENKKNSDERKSKQNELLKSLESQGLTSDQIQEVLKMNGKSEEEIAAKLNELGVTLKPEPADEDKEEVTLADLVKILDQIQINTNLNTNEEISDSLQEIEKNSEPDFTAEEKADEEIARTEEQISFLEQMVAGINGLGDKIADMSDGTGFMDILAMLGFGAAVILAPFAALGGFFVGLLESVKSIIKFIMHPIDAIKKLFGFKGLDKVDDVVKEVPKKLTRLSKFFSFMSDMFSKLTAWFKGSKGMFARILKRAFGFGRFFGKFLPFIQIITGIFDTITGAIKGFKEEGIVGAIKGGIKGLLNGLVFGLIDMVKDGVSWIAGFFGFKNIKKLLDSFSFVEMFNSLVDSIFSTFDSTIQFLKDLFTLPETFGEGLPKLVDLIYLPVNLAINWIQGIFGWDNPEEPFKISTFITDTLETIWEYMKDLFSFDVKGMFAKYNPMNLFKSDDESESENEIEKVNKKKSFWDFTDDKPNEVSIEPNSDKKWWEFGHKKNKIIEPTESIDPVLLTSQGNRNIPAIEREQQLSKSTPPVSDSLNQTNIDNSIVNHISALDMNFESPDRSLVYI